MAREVDAKTKIWDDARLEREVLEFGRSASKELPQELVTALSGRTGLSVQIIHPEKVDFPFELAILWMDGQEIFMGAAHAATDGRTLATGREFILIGERSVRVPWRPHPG